MWNVVVRMDLSQGHPVALNAVVCKTRVLLKRNDRSGPSSLTLLLCIIFTLASFQGQTHRVVADNICKAGAAAPHVACFPVRRESGTDICFHGKHADVYV